MQFKNLTIGTEFDWIDPTSFSNSFFERCVKVSVRTYRSLDGGKIYVVGDVRAKVFHVNPPASAVPRKGFRFRHARVIDTKIKDCTVGQLFQVTRVANGTAYYRPVHVTEAGETFGAASCCPVSEFSKWARPEHGR